MAGIVCQTTCPCPFAIIHQTKQQWAHANLEERRKLLLTMLNAVYIDAKQTKSIVAVRPKPPCHPIFRVAGWLGCGIPIVNKPRDGSSVFFGGGGGESNSPSKRSRPEYATSVVSSLISPGQPLLTESSQASRCFLSSPVSTSG